MSMTTKQLETHFRHIDDELSQITAWSDTFASIYRSYEIEVRLSSYIVGGIGRTILRSVHSIRRILQYIRRVYPDCSAAISRHFDSVELELTRIEGWGRGFVGADQDGINDITMTKKMDQKYRVPISRSALALMEKLGDLNGELTGLLS